MGYASELEFKYSGNTEAIRDFYTETLVAAGWRYTGVGRNGERFGFQLQVSDDSTLTLNVIRRTDTFALSLQEQ